MIACGNCKQLNQDNVRACRFCGTNLLYGTPVAAPQRPNTQPDYVPPPRGWAEPQPPPAPRPTPQPPPVAPMVPYPPQHFPQPPIMPPAGYHCPRCHSPHLPHLVSKMSQEGLIVMIVMIFLCLPLFWIGFLIKENSRVCPNCGLKVG